MSVRFMAILKEKKAEETEHSHCFILDDTTLEKTGAFIEGISRVFDHVSHKCVLGYKLLLLAYADGRSSIPVDFSLHWEKGKGKKYGLSTEERMGQYRKERNEGDADAERFAELDEDKIYCAIEMLKRAWEAGMKAAYVLRDSWFTNEKLVHEAKMLSNYQMFVLGMAKMDNRRYKVEGFMHNAHELIAKQV